MAFKKESGKNGDKNKDIIRVQHNNKVSFVLKLGRCACNNISTPSDSLIYFRTLTNYNRKFYL